MEEPAVNQTPNAETEGPAVVRVTRLGWAVMLKKRGEPDMEWTAEMGKTAAVKVACELAQKHADVTNAAVELHEEDGQGRTIRMRYLIPTPSPEPKKGNK